MYHDASKVLKNLARDKHSSLFCPAVIGEEEKLITLMPDVNAVIFSLLTVV
jgi:hypothetical protein